MGLSTVAAFKHVKVGDGMVEVTGEMLAGQQHALTMMLADIDRASREASATYTLGGGTCLGAVRHHGFIPWDDDMDLNMVHADFPAFEEALERLFPGKYLVQVPGRTPGYDLAFPRVRLRGIVVRSKEDIGVDRGECGLYVDVFYIENAPSNPIPRGLHGFVSMALGFIYSCRRFAAYRDEYLALAGDDASVARAFRFKAAVGRIVSFRSPERWTATWDWWNSRCHDGGSAYVCIPMGRRHYFRETYQRDSYFPVARAMFEGLDVPVPADAGSYLTALYGPDYMTPPPEADRETHVVYEFDLGEYDRGGFRDVGDFRLVPGGLILAAVSYEGRLAA